MTKKTTPKGKKTNPTAALTCPQDSFNYLADDINPNNVFYIETNQFRSSAIKPGESLPAFFLPDGVTTNSLQLTDPTGNIQMLNLVFNGGEVTVENCNWSSETSPINYKVNDAQFVTICNFVDPSNCYLVSIILTENPGTGGIIIVGTVSTITGPR